MYVFLSPISFWYQSDHVSLLVQKVHFSILTTNVKALARLQPFGITL